MLGIKELKKELESMNTQMISVSTEISKMSEKIIVLAEKMTESMEKMTSELNKTHTTIRDSLKITSDTIQGMSENFSEALREALKTMSEMKFQMDLKDTIIKTLGLDKVLPDFLKK
jgi:methyl-accepting chemotaxis protein